MCATVTIALWLLVIVAFWVATDVVAVDDGHVFMLLRLVIFAGCIIAAAAMHDLELVQLPSMCATSCLD